MDDKLQWVRMADEWLIAYAFVLEGTVRSPRALWPAPHLFLLGHALELYFKACLMQQGATPWGHDLCRMWSELRKDPAFLPNVPIEGEHVDSFSVNDYGSFPTRYDGQPVMFYTQLILIMKYGTGDLKYLGTKLQKVSMPYLVNWVNFDPYVWGVFKELRRYIELPGGTQDSISEILACGNLLANEREFLEAVSR